MDKFILPLDQASLSNTKVVRLQVIAGAIWKERIHNLQRYIARWVYMHGIAFNAINNVEFDQVIEAAGRFGPGGKKPNQHQLRETLLSQEVEDTRKMLKVYEEDWAKNGCSIMTDAWTDQKRWSIMNFCLHCSVGSSFLESKEVSQESHTGQLIFEYVDRYIERVGAKNVVQVVTDNASNNMAAKDLLFVKRPNSLYEKKEQLRAMSQCDEWDKFLGLNHIKKNNKGVLATATMTKPAFWSAVALCLRVFEPLVKVLRMVDSDIKPSMAFLYGDILKAKKGIMVGFRNIDKAGNLNLYNNVIEIIDAKIKDRLDTPLHLAAYFLNPYYSYNDDSIFTNEQVMDGFINAVEIFYHGDYDKQSKVLNEDLHKFKDKQGHFGKPVAKGGCKDYDFNLANWWSSYGTQAPTLQRMAIRILSLTSSSSGCERNWSCFEGIHTKKEQVDM